MADMSLIKMETTCNIKGSVVDAQTVYKRIVRVKPIEHHYEETGEEPYIKYGCPICEAFDNKHSFHKGKENCSLCGVNFEWDEIS